MYDSTESERESVGACTWSRTCFNADIDIELQRKLNNKYFLVMYTLPRVGSQFAIDVPSPPGQWQQLVIVRMIA